MIRLVVRVEMIAALAALLLPPILFGGLGPGPTFLIQGLAALCAFLFIVRWALGARPGRFSLRHPAVLVPLCFLPFLVYSFSQSFLRGAVFGGIPGSVAPFATFDHAVQFAAYMALYVSFFSFLENRERLRLVMFLLALEITLLASTGFYHSQGTQKEQAIFGFLVMPRSTHYSSFLNPNHFGAFLSASQPLFAASVAYFVRTRLREKPGIDAVEKFFFVLLVPLVALCSIGADARMALFWQFGLLAAFVAATFLRPAWIALSAVSAAAAAAWFMARVPSLALERLSADLASRLEITRDTLPILRDFSQGTGLGTSRYILAFYQKTTPENWSISHPYNHYLQLLAECGPFGTALFVVPVLCFLGWGLHRSQASPSRWDKLFGLGAFVSLAGYAMPAFFDNYLTTPAFAILYVFLAAVLARAAHGSFDPARRPAVPWRPPRRALPAALLAGAACVSVLMYLAGDYQARKAAIAGSKDALRLERATRLRPSNSIAWTELGHWHYNEASKARGKGLEYRAAGERSAAAYRKAVQAAPTWPRPWIGLARSELLLGKRRSGSRHLAFGVSLSPYHRDRILYLIHVHLKLARAERSKKQRQHYLGVAEKFARMGMRLYRPLSPADCFYVLNNAPHQLTEKQRRRVAAFLSPIYRRALPVEPS